MRRMTALCAAALFSIASTAAAQEAKRKSGCADEGDGKTKYEIVRGPDGKKIFRIKTGFCIEGKVPKPSVIYVLNASTINYQWENLKQDFIPKIKTSVEKSPF